MRIPTEVPTVPCEGYLPDRVQAVIVSLRAACVSGEVCVTRRPTETDGVTLHAIVSSEDDTIACLAESFEVDRAAAPAPEAEEEPSAILSRIDREFGPELSPQLDDLLSDSGTALWFGYTDRFGLSPIIAGGELGEPTEVPITLLGLRHWSSGLEDLGLIERVTGWRDAGLALERVEESLENLVSFFGSAHYPEERLHDPYKHFEELAAKLVQNAREIAADVADRIGRPVTLDPRLANRWGNPC